MKDSFAESHRSRSEFVAGILSVVVASINLTIGVVNHKGLLLMAGVLSLVGSVLLFSSSLRKPKWKSSEHS
jgi:hypothetical protein